MKRLTAMKRPTAMKRLTVMALALVAWCAVPGVDLLAYECDQFTGRHHPVADSTELFNLLVNQALEDIAAEWRHGRNEKRFGRAVFYRIGGLHWVDKLERFANRSDQVEKLPKQNRRGIYAGLPVWSTRFAALFGTTETMRLAGVLIGTDKIGHFLSQGHKYHRRHLRGNRPERVLRLGVRNERGLFGQLTTGVYSNADVVANYEGYLFYRGLFEDGVVAGKSAILDWQSDRPHLKRPFDWADHVNDFWDEALNPSHYDRLLQKHIVGNLKKLCPDYARAPDLFVPARYEDLAVRYAHIGLRDARYNRLDRVCD